jgi:hypothetical protein
VKPNHVKVGKPTESGEFEEVRQIPLNELAKCRRKGFVVIHDDNESAGEDEPAAEKKPARKKKSPAK